MLQVVVTQEEEMVKVGFKLNRDEDDYPPADWEWLWVSRDRDFSMPKGVATFVWNATDGWTMNVSK